MIKVTRRDPVEEVVVDEYEGESFQYSDGVLYIYDGTEHALAAIGRDWVIKVEKC